MTVRETMEKIRAARETARQLHNMGIERQAPGVFWDAEELLTEYAIVLENMKVNGGKDE